MTKLCGLLFWATLYTIGPVCPAKYCNKWASGGILLTAMKQFKKQTNRKKFRVSPVKCIKRCVDSAEGHLCVNRCTFHEDNVRKTTFTFFVSSDLDL